MTQICLSCKEKKLDKINQFAEIKTVSSDALVQKYKFPLMYICTKCGLIQKNLSRNYINNTISIYKKYKTFYQEKSKIGQSVFDVSGKSNPRSQKIFEYVASKININSEEDTILDFGCGSGINMVHLRKYFKKKNIFGYEKFVRKNSIIQKSLYNKIFDDKIFKTDLKFNIVISIFILEHVHSLEDYFNGIKALLHNNGYVVFQVPDIDSNPYDFTIYDHVFHFSKLTLKNTLKSYGFDILEIDNQIIKKEIICIAKKDEKNKRSISYSKNLKNVSKKTTIRSFNHLISDIKIMNNLKIRYGKFFVFGSSISAIWAYNTFKKSIIAFIDEDKNRVGEKIYKLKIINPNKLSYKKTIIFIPLIREISRKIKKRYPKLIFYFNK